MNRKEFLNSTSLSLMAIPFAPLIKLTGEQELFSLFNTSTLPLQDAYDVISIAPFPGCGQ